MATYKYTVVIKQNSGGHYEAEAPDFQGGTYSNGATKEECIEDMKAVLSELIFQLQEDGEELFENTPPEKIKEVYSYLDFHEAVLIEVQV